METGFSSLTLKAFLSWIRDQGSRSLKVAAALCNARRSDTETPCCSSRPGSSLVLPTLANLFWIKSSLNLRTSSSTPSASESCDPWISHFARLWKSSPVVSASTKVSIEGRRCSPALGLSIAVTRWRKIVSGEGFSSGGSHSVWKSTLPVGYRELIMIQYGRQGIASWPSSAPVLAADHTLSLRITICQTSCSACGSLRTREVFSPRLVVLT
mmetsp:Transcript_16971/g.30000  ORF Transcript_16971/g.30000 Transcript_16971/m.30000 type:complete len:212 (-) Transcript_16971:433-1068(-)